MPVKTYLYYTPAHVKRVLAVFSHFFCAEKGRMAYGLLPELAREVRGRPAGVFACQVLVAGMRGERG